MTQISAVTPPVTSSGTVAKAQTALNSDFQTFIEMLTTQAQNQDPLNPMDSAEYASQLASFSSVEQQVLTNDLLAGLAAQMGATNLSQLSSWVGMEARSAAPVQFEGDAVTLHPLPARAADEAYLVVYNALGEVVQRNQIGLDSAPINWTGLHSDGTTLPAGVYRFELENHSAGNLLGNSAVESYQRVEEAQMIEGQVVLLLEGGQAVFPDDVIGLRS